MGNSPLADRMRPRTLNEVIGQKHLLKPGGFLDRLLKIGKPAPVILYGPPGTGKTTIAKALAGTFDLPFHYVNATTGGKKDLEKSVTSCSPGSPAIIFIDEAHRFNTAQQDFMLPYTESGAAVTIMASTENPYHQIIPGLRSRMRILELKKLEIEDIKEGIERALLDKERGLGELELLIEPGAAEALATLSNGDMRIALSTLEMAALSAGDSRAITEPDIRECLQTVSHHDKKGDQYYDLLAALQKSVQGSAVDAALHYASRLMDAGELDMLMRRLVVIAHEDIGLAATDVGTNAIVAWQGVKMVGMPEARIIIGKLIVEMCLSPKSNSAYMAVNSALEDIRKGYIGEIPKPLRDSSYGAAAMLGNGVGYKYPHDYFIENFGGWINQEYMPVGMEEKKYYFPIMAGDEVVFGKRLLAFKRARGK